MRTRGQFDSQFSAFSPSADSAAAQAPVIFKAGRLTGSGGVNSVTFLIGATTTLSYDGSFRFRPPRPIRSDITRCVLLQVRVSEDRSISARPTKQLLLSP